MFFDSPVFSWMEHVVLSGSAGLHPVEDKFVVEGGFLRLVGSRIRSIVVATVWPWVASVNRRHRPPLFSIGHRPICMDQLE